MLGKLTGIQRLFGGEWVLSFSTAADAGAVYEKLKDVPVNVEIRKHNPGRSKDANAFCWALCTDIGKALTPPIPKEEVYRKAIRDVGEYEPLPIREDAVETFQRRWASHGTGWFAEVVDDSKLKGYKLVFAYYGSSTYDTAAMSRLIDYLVQDAREMGLSLPATKEQEEMLKSWQAKA
jgi:hypothetical protein